MMGAPDQAAVRTLLRTYWSSAGWRENRSTPSADLRQAIAAGVMFSEPRVVEHDELVADVRELAARADAQLIADAFVSSLSSRRLDLRSALGSFAVARHLPEHPFAPRSGTAGCAICGANATDEIDRNILNFERFKWGGVRRLDLTYLWHDLELFARDAAPSSVSGKDRSLLSTLLADLEQAPPDLTAPRAAQTLLRKFPSNVAERGVVLDILGVCSVLETPEHNGFKDRFVRDDDRPLPPERFVELAYPVCWWRGEHGVSADALREFALG